MLHYNFFARRNEFLKRDFIPAARQFESSAKACTSERGATFRTGLEREMPDASSLLYIILIGLVAGVLASIVIPTGVGLLGTIVIGVAGAAIGSWLFPALGARVSASPAIATIITSTVGAILLLFVLRLVRR
jgi:uncharacterized membrane protein YeaQ/YmgE (transglycosylase-associated protein family)